VLCGWDEALKFCLRMVVGRCWLGGVAESRFYRSLDEIASHLRRVREAVDFRSVGRVVDEIVSRRRVFVYGAGRSGLVARCFAQRLMHIGVESYVVGETINPSVRRGDVVLIVSGSGETTSPVCIGRRARELGAFLVVLTAHPNSTLGRMADVVLVVPGKTKLVERESYAPFTSLFDIAALSVLDSIASEIMGRLGVGEELISIRHANLE